MSGLILPKTDDQGIPYLSYSQYSTWKKNKREYIRQYFFGEKFDGNSYTDFGGEIGLALEHNDFSAYSATEQELLRSIPRYDEFEREIKLQMKGFYVKGFIDTNTKPQDYGNGLPIHIRRIADYKTGDVVKKESEYQSDDYTQLDIYSAALEQEFGVLPDSVSVFLIDRKGNAFAGEKLVLGNKFVTITKNVTKERVKTVKDNLQKTAEEISEYYKLFLQLNGLR